jgi:hypothetical protein
VEWGEERRERDEGRGGEYQARPRLYSQASRRRIILDPGFSAFPFIFSIKLALVTRQPFRGLDAKSRNRRPYRRPRKAPTGVWCSHLSRTRTFAGSSGSMRRSSRSQSHGRSERREVSLGLCATRTRYHLRGSRAWKVVSGCNWKTECGDSVPSLPLMTKLPSMPPKQLRIMCRPCRCPVYSRARRPVDKSHRWISWFPRRIRASESVLGHWRHSHLVRD